jgi:hypothetical protein
MRYVFVFVMAAFATGAAPEKASPLTVKVDTTEVPELAAWADESKTLVEHWHPLIAELLKSDGFTPPAEVALVYKKDMDGVAATARDRIYVAAGWVKKHPEDKGMIIHELTHVIQSYPPTRDGWLVEGIADYVRFFHFEPETALTPPDPKTASYRDSYRTAATFLAWVEKTHDKAVVRKLNSALRRGVYRPRLFKEATGKTVDELWTEYVNGLKK